MRGGEEQPAPSHPRIPCCGATETVGGRGSYRPGRGGDSSTRAAVQRCSPAAATEVPAVGVITATVEVASRLTITGGGASLRGDRI